MGMSLGSLSLGAPNGEQAQVFTTSNEFPTSIDGFTPSGGLYNSSRIPSYSFGMHLGSRAFTYPGSLFFGGYDRGRVIGPVISWDSNRNSPMLIDIGLGVETGGTPEGFNIIDKVVPRDGSGAVSTDPFPVEVDSYQPYLRLPPGTCDAISKSLPVYFDSTIKFWLWNSSDKRTAPLIGSPAYLGFFFSAGSSANVTVKVPLALLNLTLSPPISKTNVAYFPCVDHQAAVAKAGDPKPVPLAILGRAFLQSAFWGNNFNRGVGWLAQAPGPGQSRDGMGYAPKDIEDSATSLDVASDTTLFADSWKPHWTEFAKAKAPTTGPSEEQATQKSGLSTGTKAGIGAGAAIGGLLLIGAVCFLIRRGRTGTGLETPSSNELLSIRPPSELPSETLSTKPESNMQWKKMTDTEMVQAEPVELAGTHAVAR